MVVITQKAPPLLSLEREMLEPMEKSGRIKLTDSGPACGLINGKIVVRFIYDGKHVKLTLEAEDE